MEIFVDSDVVISSLLSSTGAAYLLLHDKEVNPIISSFSMREIEIVVDRLKIKKSDFQQLVSDKLKVVEISTSLERIKTTFCEYVLDVNDAHVIAGADAAKVRFLITYNLKEFKIEKIKNDFNIIILTPGQFLQYSRSLE